MLKLSAIYNTRLFYNKRYYFEFNLFDPMDRLISKKQTNNYCYQQKSSNFLEEDNGKRIQNSQVKHNRQSKKKMLTQLERQNQTHCGNKQNVNFNSKKSQARMNILPTKNQTKGKNMRNNNNEKSSNKKTQQKANTNYQYTHIKHILVHDKKKIPKIISELEKNIVELKKCYNEEHKHKIKAIQSFSRQSFKQNQKNLNTNSTNYTLNVNHNLISSLLDKKIPRKNSQKKLKKTYSQTRLGIPLKHSKNKTKPINSQKNQFAQFQNKSANQNIQPQIQVQDVRKSYVSTYGKNTSNLLQLYNFYKKQLQRSTHILGSMSMSHNAKIHSMSINSKSGEDFSSIQQVEFLRQKPKCVTPLILQQSNQYQISMREPSVQKVKKDIQKLIKYQNSKLNSKSSSKKIDEDSRDSYPFSKQRKSAVLTNPFLEQVGIGADLNFNRDVLKKSCKDFLNIQNLINERRIEKINQKQQLQNQALLKQITKVQKINQKLEDKFQFKQHFAQKKQKQFSFLTNLDRVNSAQRSLNLNKVQKYTQNRKLLFQDQQSSLVYNGTQKSQNNVKQKERDEQIYKSPAKKENVSCNIVKPSQRQNKQKKSGIKSSDNKSSDKRSSSKKSANILNQAIFLQTQGVEKQSKQSFLNNAKKLQSQKYYVQPISLGSKKGAISNSLQGLQITLKDSDSSRNLDLDFIPLDI